MKIAPPHRVSRSYTQHLQGTPAEVFPLLCPVREAEWVQGWAPRLVLSESGVAERDCLFITPEATAEGEREAVWCITEHDAAAGRIEMLKVTPGFVVIRLSITLTSADAEATDAQITYTYTALGPAGDAYVSGRSEAAYTAFMRDWEAALNAHLRRARTSPQKPEM